MNDNQKLYKALAKRFDNVRVYSGFTLNQDVGKMEAIICLELKENRKWLPLIKPKFETKKEAVAAVKSIKKMMRENFGKEKK